MTTPPRPPHTRTHKMNDELERLMREAQTAEPWTVVWYGDEHLPAIAIHRSAEDRVCFMPTIQHPADGVQAEANAALIVAAVNALPELLDRVRRQEEALRWYADRSNYNDIPLRIDTSQEFRYDPAPAVKDGGKRARAALKETGQ